VLLLYDYDSNKRDEDAGLVSIRSIPKKDNNDVAKKGIENLLPPELFRNVGLKGTDNLLSPELFQAHLYPTKEKTGDYGEVKSSKTWIRWSFVAGCARGVETQATSRFFKRSSTF
jgi:hypothetical protein